MGFRTHRNCGEKVWEPDREARLPAYCLADLSESSLHRGGRVAQGGDGCLRATSRSMETQECRKS